MWVITATYVLIIAFMFRWAIYKLFLLQNQIENQNTMLKTVFDNLPDGIMIYSELVTDKDRVDITLNNVN